MNKNGLAILMRTRMRPSTDPTTSPALPLSQHKVNQMINTSKESQFDSSFSQHSAQEGVKHSNTFTIKARDFDCVRVSMHSAITLNKTEVLDTVVNDFAEGYLSLSLENRRKLLFVLAKVYDLNRTRVHDLIKQYLDLEPPFCTVDESNDSHSNNVETDTALSSFYRIERILRQALKPTYDVLFERLNNHPGGLHFLSIIRADILSIIAEENVACLRALDSHLKEKLSAWLSPAALELHQITWDDPASVLEKIVAYEAVHPISNLLDLKRRLGVGRRCFGYLHPAIPGEPLIFIEVALSKDIAQTVREVLWDNPPIPECDAKCALFYSISSTQPGLAGINLGKFLIKRVIKLVKRDMPHISIFATLSPIPGFMQWLVSKLASQSVLAEVENESQSSSSGSVSMFKENILEPEEEKLLMSCTRESVCGKSGMEVMLELLTSTKYEWTKSANLVSALKPPLMRLCVRYLLQEKKRGKALDPVANFHLQNGAMIERINWMADNSEKGLRQSGGIMVNYVYRVQNIEEFSQSYFSSGHIHASDDIRRYNNGTEGA